MADSPRWQGSQRRIGLTGGIATGKSSAGHWLAAGADAPVLVLMVPLLFEANLTGLCSEVWLVDCEEEQQLQRLIARDHCSEAEARARIAAQWPLARKRALAQVVLDNRGAPGALAPQVRLALDDGMSTPSAT